MATVENRALKPAAAGINDDIGEETRLKLYRSQVLLREAEQRAFDLFLQNLVKGTSHLSLGQEAVAAGFGCAMQPGDLSFCTYRGHAHTLARGVPVEKVLGELMQRDNGLMRGKGGSMHLTSAEHGVMGSYAIIGAHLPIACGAAWRAQYKGAKDVSVCFFGDGTTNIGAFHEAVNLAVVWKLPVVFVCENNLYMEYTPIGEVTAVAHPAADRASAYGLERILPLARLPVEAHAAAEFVEAQAGVLEAVLLLPGGEEVLVEEHLGLGLGQREAVLELDLQREAVGALLLAEGGDLHPAVHDRGADNEDRA